MKKIKKVFALVEAMREISFLATMLGALWFFSELLHLSFFVGLSEKLGVSFDVISWIVLVSVMFLVGVIARHSIKQKFEEEESTEEEDKKLSVEK